ncbi:MAG: minichromosome maintenance protein MCM [Candidatus Njordarchaeia archaeon]
MMIGALIDEEKLKEIEDAFYDFLINYSTIDEEGKIRNKYLEKIRVIVGEEDSKSIVVDFEDVSRHNYELGEEILSHPELALLAANNALRRAISFIHEDLEEKKVRKYIVRLRRIGAPTRIRNLTRSDLINSFVEFKAIIVKATKIRELLKRAYFQCDVCGMKFPVEFQDKFVKPTFCPNPNCDNEDPRKFTLLPNEQEFEEYQELTAQELPEELPPGQLPQSINVVVRGDLTGKIRPGDRVKIYGILKVRPDRDLRSGKKPLFSVYVEATYLEKETADEKELVLTEEEKKLIQKLKEDKDLENKIVQSIAPSIYGEEEIKKAIAALLFGGIPKILPDGTKIRGTINVLLVGDPGTGKSQLLKYVASIAPRAVYTSGKGSSAAGLTAAVVRTEDEWALEAGVMVLADKGVACIDEFDKMSVDDRKALHEAMEQLTVSIAKAGIVATLNARTSILAAANPKLGRYNEKRSIAENINLPPTIISRFDLIFVMKDVPNLESDRLKTKHVLGLHAGEIRVEPPIPPNLLKKYIMYARENVFPKLTEGAANKIEEFYLMMRNMSAKEKQEELEQSPIAITTRQLEALVRLAEAHARMLLKDEVDEEDAEFAINLVKFSLEQVGKDPESGKIDTGMLYSGYSHTKRSKYYTVIDILRSLEKEEKYKDGVPLRDIVEIAKEREIQEDFVLDVIKKELRSGNIYEPRPGYYKTIPL